MARVTVEDCLGNVANRFELVLVAAKRARQLAHGQEAQLAWENDKPTVMALREIADGLVGPSILEEKPEPEEELAELVEDGVAGLRYRYEFVDQDGFDESVEPARQPARRQLQHVGEVAHAHPLVVGLAEVHEHLIVAEREPGRREVALDGGDQVGLDLDERAPGRHLAGVEPPRVGRHGASD